MNLVESLKHYLATVVVWIIKQQIFASLPSYCRGSSNTVDFKLGHVTYFGQWKLINFMQK